MLQAATSHKLLQVATSYHIWEAVLEQKTEEQIQEVSPSCYAVMQLWMLQAATSHHTAVTALDSQLHQGQMRQSLPQLQQD
jgi:hypothetical protein